jgi:hypothetical protein
MVSFNFPNATLNHIPLMPMTRLSNHIQYPINLPNNADKLAIPLRRIAEHSQNIRQRLLMAIFRI